MVLFLCLSEFSTLRSSEIEQVERVKATQSKQLSPNVNGTERTQQQKDADLNNNFRINKMSLKQDRKWFNS